MDKKNTLYLDFDGTYKNKPPNDNVIVLTNLYSAEWAILINADRSNRNQALFDFEESYLNFDKNNKFLSFNLDISKSVLFKNFFFPLSQWLFTIESLINHGKIDINSKVEFSSFSNNRKVFILDAEGETNGQFLYKKSYFLSYYILQFVIQSGFEKIILGKNKSLQSKVSFFIRGPIILFLKALQLIFYKLFVIKRNYLTSQQRKRLLAVSSRGIVQTYFIKGLYERMSQSMILFVNEASSKPFRNFNAVRKTCGNFYYSEGNLTFQQLGEEFFLSIKNYFNKKKCLTLFRGVNVNLYDLIPELGIHHFHMKTYAHSLNNSIKTISKDGFEFDKIISLEMLSPFSFYLKESNIPIIQIQGAALHIQNDVDFVYGDKFYFYSRMVYDGFMDSGFRSKREIGYINNIQYVNYKKLEKKKNFKVMTYFTQPMYFDEEIILIDFLKTFCKKYSLDLQIKLHPRSPSLDVDLEKIKIIKGSENSQRVVLNSDIVVTRTSSIGLDSWFANIPVIFFINNSFKNTKSEFIPENYSGVIREDISIEKFAEKLNSIIDDFYTQSFHKELEIDFDKIKSELFK